MTPKGSEWRSSPTVLRNTSCPYCGETIAGRDATKEHVIGRRFVPRGSLDGSWNLILRACQRCNLQKAELEDQVSACTMQPPIVGAPHERDNVLRREASRKQAGTCGLRKDRGLQRFSVGGQMMPGVSVRFDIVAPPSPGNQDIRLLAWYHMSAFFYMVTYQTPRGLGGFMPGAFRPVQCASRSDWGNERLQVFASSITAWPYRLWLQAASGYFKALIRRDPSGVCWAWAMEWNTNYRVAGFFGHPTRINQIVASLPQLPESVVGQTADGELRVRVECPVEQSSDTLFDRPIVSESATG